MGVFYYSKHTVTRAKVYHIILLCRKLHVKRECSVIKGAKQLRWCKFTNFVAWPWPGSFRGLPKTAMLRGSCVPNLVKIGPKLSSQSCSHTPNGHRTDICGTRVNLCYVQCYTLQWTDKNKPSCVIREICGSDVVGCTFWTPQDS